MTEGVKPSASEEARAAARAADLRKSKPVQSVAGQYGAQQAASSQTKKLGTSFDEALKQSSEQSAAKFLSSENKFDSPLQSIKRDDERGSERDRDDDKKQDQKAGGEKGLKDTQASAKERVLAKHSAGEQRQGSGSDSGEQRKGGGSQQRGFQKGLGQDQALQSDLKKRVAVPAPVPGEVVKSQILTVTPPEIEAAPRGLPKALLDQIVQCVTIKKNHELNQEIQIDFRDNVFHGLRLKLVARGKEISIEFLVPNWGVEACFKKERENIAMALGEKGIDVRFIQVTCI